MVAKQSEKATSDGAAEPVAVVEAVEPSTAPLAPAAAPLAPPGQPAGGFEPGAGRIQVAHPPTALAGPRQDSRFGDWLGYFDEAGEPVDPAEAFDLAEGDPRTVLVSKMRIYSHNRPAGITTNLITLAVPEGSEVPRAWVENAIAQHQALG